MITKAKSGPVTEARAREIMGKNFFGMDEAVSHFFVVPTEEQFEFLSKVPFSEETLMECKDTHLLVAVFPMSIIDIKRLYANLPDQTLFYPRDWYDAEPFVNDRGEVGWWLFRKLPVAGSMSKKWEEQSAVLSKDEDTPSARIVVYSAIGHFLKSGERLFESVCVRCADLDSQGFRVLVGRFGAEGFRINAWRGNYVSDDIGLAAARKQ
ncbi:MAG: hypothetical protein WC763_01520 [Candidatus Paceibacterota bacterium]|jgi:hypothetical protein